MLALTARRRTYAATSGAVQAPVAPGIPLPYPCPPRDGAGKDTLDAGPSGDTALDTLYGEDGDDTIKAVNLPAFTDVVNCGPGSDDGATVAPLDTEDPLGTAEDRCENVLRISERTGDRVSGYFDKQGNSTHVEFESYVDGEEGGVLLDGHPYDRGTSSVITLDDDTLPGDEPRLRLKLTINPETKKIKMRITTPDSSAKKLSDEDRRALNKAGELLDKFLDRKGRGDCNMKNAETLVLRQFALISDTSKDHTFEDLEITHKVPENKCGSNQNTATTNLSATNLSARGVPGLAVAEVCPANTPGEVNRARTRLDRPAGPLAFQGQYVPLQYEGGDGIDYLDCGSSDNAAYYDLSGGDPSYSDSVYGPDSSEELGTCGPSESDFLEFAYTQDCLDHDYCTGSDEGGDGFFDCVDEFFFAIDGTIYSAITSPYGDDCETVVPSASGAGNTSVSYSPGARNPGSPTTGGPMLASKKA